jgi:heme/copper-type cytochrome/quinol oxidase subunit 3
MTLWWGMVLFIAIEGSVLGVLVATHLYLWAPAPAWPPADTPPPGLLWATLNAGLLAASMPLGYLTDRAARRERHRATLVLLGAMIVVGVACLGLRALELVDLNVRWDSNAYGSILWMILGVHATHVLAETLENVLLAIVFCCGRRERKHFVDVHVNMVYWYFVAGAWLLLYGLVFLLPQLQGRGS